MQQLEIENEKLNALLWAANEELGRHNKLREDNARLEALNRAQTLKLERALEVLRHG